MKFKFKFDQEGWWIDDKQGFKNTTWILLGRASHESDPSVVMIQLVVLWFRFAVGWKRNKIK